MRYIKLQDDGRIRIGIIGTGANVSVADWHTRGIIHDRRARISAVYNRRESTTQRWKDRFSLDAVSCTTPEMLLEACDAVVICTPNSTHYQYAMAALAAGKHVLLEKPMTLSLEQAEQLEAVAGQMGVHCCVGYTYRFTQAADQLRSLVRNHIGNVYTVQASLGGTRLADAGIGMDWRMYQALSGAGALEDFGSHFNRPCALCDRRDLFHGVLPGDIFIKNREGENGPEPVETDDSARSPAVVEAGLATFLSAAWDWMPADAWREKEGWRVTFGEETTLCFWEKQSGGPYGGGWQNIPLAQETPFEDWFRWETGDFLDGIEGKPARGASFQDGCYVERVLEAARCSAENGTVNRIEKEDFR
ncbi:MAG: Gfo/Idh/MocA family protein [Hungatella hathewayi]